MNEFLPPKGENRNKFLDEPFLVSSVDLTIRPPSLLVGIPQWVAWKEVLRDGGWSKVPITPRGSGPFAKSTDQKTWGAFAQALDFYERSRYARDPASGVGFVLTRANRIVGFDLDKCLDEELNPSPLARAVLDIAETYTEISPSRRGLRLFAKGEIVKGFKLDQAGVEVYCEERYLTVTGMHWAGTPREILPAPRTLALLRDHVDRLRAERAQARGRQAVEANSLSQRARATFGVTDPNASRHRKYAIAALAAECDMIADAPEGTRNTQLNRSTFLVGTLVGAGWISEGEATEALAAAGRWCGLPEDEIERLIMRVLPVGIANPRSDLKDTPIPQHIIDFCERLGSEGHD